MSAGSFGSFLNDLQQSLVPQILCLAAQIIISVVIIDNIINNWHSFPIKQLSPTCTISAVLSLFLVNLLSFIARIIEKQQYLYKFDLLSGISCGQCRLYNHPNLIALALFYVAFRQFPLILFALKTIRVSICFIDDSNNKFSKWTIIIFSRQLYILLLSLAYACLIGIANYLQLLYSQNGLTASSAQLTFQLLCPKQSSPLDWIACCLRLLFLMASYWSSINTYKQLDFKRFLFFIFMLSNSQVLLRLGMVLGNLQLSTYHQFYYHSLLLNLLGTIILYPYSLLNFPVQQPPGTAILQNFNAFINYTPGRNILQFYAHYRDQQENCTRFSKCYLAYLQISQMKKLLALNQFQISQCYSILGEIVKSEEIQSNIQINKGLREKLSSHRLQIADVKRLEKKLQEFCEIQLFRLWKRTKSRNYITEEFRRNMVIDQKMQALNIQIGG